MSTLGDNAVPRILTIISIDKNYGKALEGGWPDRNSAQVKIPHGDTFTRHHVRTQHSFTRADILAEKGLQSLVLYIVYYYINFFFFFLS